MGPNHQVVFEYGEKRLNQSQWSKLLGISRAELWRRIKKGMAASIIFSGPFPKRVNKRSLRPRAVDDPSRNPDGTMKKRCTNPNSRNYKRYGGRGITVCERWQSFENFFSDMGKKPSPEHSIDRINNDGNYEPSNCRWATRIQQRENQTFYQKLYTIKGETLNQSEWSEKIGVSRLSFDRRVRDGWAEEDVLRPAIPYTETREGLKKEVYRGRLLR